jgi:2-polyprenyl-6-methoxyphenol hydroxylase-like FAD-dependent oxidoreductase
MRVVCVGGGPAGLFFAILIKEHDRRHEVAVFERNPAGVTEGWGVVFWDSLLDQLHASDPVTGQLLATNAFRWGGEQLVVGAGAPVGIPGHGYGIGRQRLLDLLVARALSLGVEVEFEHEVRDRSELPDADLVVACDGVSSRLRERHADTFGTAVIPGRNMYIWLGTSKVFDVFTFPFVHTPAGWIWGHAYGYAEGASTFIVECSPETWSGLGFPELDASQTLALLESVFAEQLDGHKLRTSVRPGGSAPWLSFRTVTNERWHLGKLALMGDAAHTTHFTIGSGTKLALEDAIALASELAPGGELEPALEAYGRRRRQALRRAQTDARFSARWFEEVDRYAGGEPERFFALLRERRSPLLPWIPPVAYYQLHRATHEVEALRRLRRWAAPRIKGAYAARPSRGTRA